MHKVDRSLSGEKELRRSGATASIALLQTLDKPAPPFFAAKNLALTVAHVGYPTSGFIFASSTHSWTVIGTRV